VTELLWQCCISSAEKHDLHRSTKLSQCQWWVMQCQRLDQKQ